MDSAEDVPIDVSTIIVRSRFHAPPLRVVEMRDCGQPHRHQHESEIVDVRNPRPLALSTRE